MSIEARNPIEVAASGFLYFLNLMLASLPVLIRVFVLGVAGDDLVTFRAIFASPDAFFFVSVWSLGSVLRILVPRGLVGLRSWQRASMMLSIFIAVIGSVLYAITLMSVTSREIPGHSSLDLNGQFLAVTAATMMGASMVASLAELRGR